jgi:hypothetical protein
MKKFNFWYHWLLTISWLIIGFGLYIVVVALTQASLFENFNKPVMKAFNLSPETVPIAVFKWLFSVLGATMAGWGVMILFLIRRAFRNKEKWAWCALAASIFVWFIPDTTMSVFYGVYFNVFVNSVLFLVVIVPLLFTWKEFGIFQKQTNIE